MSFVVYVIIMIITTLIVEFVCKKIEKFFKEVFGDVAQSGIN